MAQAARCSLFAQDRGDFALLGSTLNNQASG
jgi:hypothetical protein